MYILDELRRLLNLLPAELVNHPTIARGIGEFVSDSLNREIALAGVPYTVTVTFNPPQP